MKIISRIKRGTILIWGFVIILVMTGLILLQHYHQFFNSTRAFKDIEYQVSIGPRIPGSDAHSSVANYIIKELKEYGWQVEAQHGFMNGKSLTNIIAKRGTGEEWIILGTHYDSRIFADNDPNAQNRLSPVPGANDGASGVAVLLELGRVLPKSLGKEIWLVFFDLEDQGRIEDANWIEGSSYFAQNLLGKPDAVVVVDMVGDENLNLYQEQNSSKSLTAEIWAVAANLGYQDTFISEEKHSIMDDHFPFLEKGINAIVIIDIEYEHWHTTSDTVDKISAQSLSIVGETLYNWLIIK